MSTIDLNIKMEQTPKKVMIPRLGIPTLCILAHNLPCIQGDSKVVYLYTCEAREHLAYSVMN